MPISEAELDVAIEVALRAAHVATCIVDRAIEERDSTLLDIQTKQSSVDLVTQYDKLCEEEIFSVLRTGTPQYDVLGEESHGNSDLSSVITDKPTWIVDPIDGTTSFIHGLFDHCVSIALVVDRQPVVGVVSAPRLQEVYSAVIGRGACCNGQRIRVSECRSLGQAIVYMHQSYGCNNDAVDSVIAIQEELLSQPVHALRSHGSSALDMCFVASGRAELYFEAGIYPWDIAAGTVIVREAGGVVHNIDDPESLDLASRTVCCANSPELARVGMELAAKHNYKKLALGRGPSV
ncbi:putative Inositol monophosphatase family [Trypanosoma vivax]|uniref:Inositol-1-monophosphatase n=1 Tax=Trypanosoma vivax (strain Y486) TaxID=1055687 RepID=G0TVN3_TRYVY|nr:putative myo-inositol-1(or 4)-monophosphatase 1 [Trypanosoma vivax]KAH8620623.1 putative Inositol monophosphatase family [Trypanosoma vivax]CCC47999.1 putative myo-inositol-1(or 4)-monophosphatase 1 [Trypanosoma vivax Y486]